MNEKEARDILNRTDSEGKNCCSHIEALAYLEAVEKAKGIEEALLWCIRYFKEIDDKVKIDFIEGKLDEWEKKK